MVSSTETGRRGPSLGPSGAVSRGLGSTFSTLNGCRTDDLEGGSHSFESVSTYPNGENGVEVCLLDRESEKDSLTLNSSSYKVRLSFQIHFRTLVIRITPGYSSDYTDFETPSPPCLVFYSKFQVFR